MAYRFLKSTDNKDWNDLCTDYNENEDQIGCIFDHSWIFYDIPLCPFIVIRNVICYTLFSIENQSSSEQLKDSADRVEDTTNEAFLNSYLSLDNDDLSKIAHQPADMIKYCKMHSRHGTEKCNELIQGIAKPFTSIYGVCYMFNFAVKGYTNNTLVSNYGGPSFGLELILDIEIKY